MGNPGFMESEISKKANLFLDKLFRSDKRSRSPIATLIVGAGISHVSPTNLPLFNPLRDQVYEALLDSLPVDAALRTFCRTLLADDAPETLFAVFDRCIGDDLFGVLRFFGTTAHNVTHTQLAQAAGHGRIEIYTPNYDTCIEHAASRSIKVHHWHGSIEDPGTMRITFNDYDLMCGGAERIVGLLRDAITNRPIVVMGYAGRDPDFREAFRRIHEELPEQDTRIRGYWLCHDPSGVDDQELHELLSGTEVQACHFDVGEYFNADRRGANGFWVTNVVGTRQEALEMVRHLVGANDDWWVTSVRAALGNLDLGRRAAIPPELASRKELTRESVVAASKLYKSLKGNAGFTSGDDRVLSQHLGVVLYRAAHTGTSANIGSRIEHCESSGVWLDRAFKLALKLSRGNPADYIHLSDIAQSTANQRCQLGTLYHERAYHSRTKGHQWNRESIEAILRALEEAAQKAQEALGFYDQSNPRLLPFRGCVNKRFTRIEGGDDFLRVLRSLASGEHDKRLNKCRRRSRVTDEELEALASKCSVYSHAVLLSITFARSLEWPDEPPDVEPERVESCILAAENFRQTEALLRLIPNRVNDLQGEVEVNCGRLLAEMGFVHHGAALCRKHRDYFSEYGPAGNAFSAENMRRECWRLAKYYHFDCGLPFPGDDGGQADEEDSIIHQGHQPI